MPEQGIRLIVGLGNPGPPYEATRHNVGFWFVDVVAARHDGQFRAEAKFHGSLCRLLFGGRDIRLLKPATFMNRSGQSVGALARYQGIPPQAILVAHDELDLPVGTARLKLGGGHAGHNGLRDIIQVLGSADFWRLRIGIDHPGNREQVVSYVLGRPSRDDEKRILTALDDAELCLPELIIGEFQRAMNRLHSCR